VDTDISSAKKELQAKQTLRELSCGGLIHDWSPLFGFLLYCMRGNRNNDNNNRLSSSSSSCKKAATAATATVASPGSLQWILLDALGRGHLAP
jgi:hypothetical protein